MITVLYVGADSGLYLLISPLFERTGSIVVVPAATAKEALEWIFRYCADVIISVQDRWGVSGRVLLRTLRENGFSTPVIFFCSTITETPGDPAGYANVFSVSGRECADRRTIMTLLRMVYWAAGNSDREVLEGGMYQG